MYMYSTCLIKDLNLWGHYVPIKNILVDISIFLGTLFFYILHVHTWNMQSYAKKLAITFFVKFSD